MSEDKAFRILLVDLDSGRGEFVRFGDKSLHLGGSGLAAALFEAYGLPDAPALDPGQPLILAIGLLTGCYPLMSKTVCAFKSPYHEQYAESHAGGRLALALRFAHIDALVVRGRAKSLSCLSVGHRQIHLNDVHYLRGTDIFTAGKILRKTQKSSAGHRSMLRIGPAGENMVPMACINVDTYRHFGRLGAGAVMGSKNLKAIMVDGASAFPAPPGKAYPDTFKEIYQAVTGTAMMRKYHDLGTAENLAALDGLKALPWFNLQKTSDPAIDGVSGERFARDLLLRKSACCGCPVGCIHIGLLRELFATDNAYLYRQVSYDYEPIFSCGTMLGIKEAPGILAVVDEVERQGLDVMSGGIALAWATEATEKGLISEKETIVKLAFGDPDIYRKALGYMGSAANEFYQALGKGSLVAAAKYGGEDFACVLGQEMAGYATGEIFYVSQALGFRHSHLDSGGYSLDQKSGLDKAPQNVVKLMVDDEQKRVALTSMVSCLFARAVYTDEVLGRALSAMGYEDVAANLGPASQAMQGLRWKNRFRTGFVPEAVKIPKRFMEVVNWKGQADPVYLGQLRQLYELELRRMAGQ